MGLFGLLTGWDQNKAANNAVLASHLAEHLDGEQKKAIATLIANSILRFRTRGSAEVILRELNKNCRVTQMNFIALACNDLGIQPLIKGSDWLSVRNPYLVGGYTKEKDISFSVRWYEKRSGVRVNWPGDDVKVDFLNWYIGPTGAKPKRGEDTTATATVPLETALLGGSARVLLPTGRAFDVTIPAGIEDGKQIRLRGQGHPGPIGGEPGDALISIKIAPLDEREAARFFNLGAAYARGEMGLPQDDREAARLYKLAADRGLTDAQFYLGTFYESGRGGLPQDDRQAARLYKLAADQGFAAAQYCLGYFYQQGRGGLPQDDRQAARLYKLAADQGEAAAQLGLGRFYHEGRGGLPLDNRQAEYFFKLAADQGFSLDTLLEFGSRQQEEEQARQREASEREQQRQLSDSARPKPGPAAPAPLARSRARFQIGRHEFREPDYCQILIWAKALELDPEALVQALEETSFKYKHLRNSSTRWDHGNSPNRWDEGTIGFKVEQGAIKSLAWDFFDLPIKTFDWVQGLCIQSIAVFDGSEVQLRRFSAFDIPTEQPNISFSLPCLRQLFIGPIKWTKVDLRDLPGVFVLWCCGTARIGGRGNQLTKLDLSGLPNLTTLWCNHNTLTTLDLAGVPNLTFLDCRDNELTTLDLSGVPNLTLLDCNNNLLTELDLTGVPSLTLLDCGNNELTELDLSGVRNLIGLECGYNELNKLDLSGLSGLTQLTCYDNRLTELDLLNVPNLKRLSCGQNSLTELDVTANTALEYLYCDPSVNVVKLPSQNFKR
jgi:hypothetical protein